jgi:ABC-type branched-subunit amino acid transport system substrate-binding protein
VIRAGVALPLTGRYGPLARQAERGLRAWAATAGAALRVDDCGEEPADAAVATMAVAENADVVFGPYGSGAMRAVAAAFAGSPVVVWNHGGTASPRTGARVVDVVGSADTYWAGLADVLVADGVGLDGVAVLHADTGFGNAVASGAAESLAAAGATPVARTTFDASTASAAAEEALAAGARVVIGCGRWEDDIALGRALIGADVGVGLVACGVRDAHDALGNGIVGWLGPCAWLAHDDPPPVPLGAGADYPAAQALAAGLIAQQVLAGLGTWTHDAIWDAVRAVRTSTFVGPFAVDGEGRQTAHRPSLVRWVPSPAGACRRVVWRPAAEMV